MRIGMVMGDVAEPGKYYSPIYKKLISKVGETIDLAGKAIIGFAAITAKPGHLGDLASISAGQWTLFAVGGVVVAIGIYFSSGGRTMNPFAALAGQPYLQIAAFLAIVFGGGGSLVGFAAIIAGRRQRDH